MRLNKSRSPISLGRNANSFKTFVMLFDKNLTFTIAVPGTVAFYIPLLMYRIT
jgi:hypothetical protein